MLSIDAITLAFAASVTRSSTKFVLVALADRANEDSLLCWPSVKYLCGATGQDRKTVIENLNRLQADGFISDTGQRVGQTKQIVVYQLLLDKSIPKTGPLEPEEQDGLAQLNNPENGTVKTGTVPFFPLNSSVFPSKESRFSLETVPKTGHGTISEPSVNRQQNRKQTAVRKTGSDYSPEFEQAWTGYPRKGDTSKVDAFSAWRARLNAGCPADEMAAGVLRYAAYCAAEKTENKFIKQPATFFGPKEFFKLEWTPNRPAPPTKWGGESRHLGFDNIDYTAGVSADGRF